MSKAAKKSLLILGFLLVLSLGFAGVTYINLENTESAKQAVEQEYSEAQGRFKAKERQNAANTKKLNTEITKVNNEKTQFISQIKRIEENSKRQIDGLSAQIKEITSDRDKWKRRIESIRGERDQLMTKIAKLTKELEERPEPQVVYKEKELQQPKMDMSRAPSMLPGTEKVVNEGYWADLLKQKASLEVSIKELKEDISAKSIAVVEIKQANEDLQLEVDILKNSKEELDVEIQHKANMIDNISLELARTKNDKKFISDRSEKMNAENKKLRQQLKQLVSVKNALEKSIVRVTQEKNKVENKLGQSETLIQSKIDEIWEIKDELDISIRSAQSDANITTNGVELPPIVVSSTGESENFNTGEAPSGFNGRVISINESNNFVIVDIGEDSGIRMGDSLSVYRDSKYVARLEVIQVRKDISAADLKDQWSKVKVGDIIR